MNVSDRRMQVQLTRKFCLRQGRFEGARLILGVGMRHLAEGKLDARGRQARGREARWFALNYPCCLRWRQGCGGLCPHPLKGLGR